MTSSSVLTQKQAEQVLATCATNSPIDLRDRALFIVGLETGMRRMSLAGMMLETIKRSSNGHGYPSCIVPLQGGREYTVPLSDAAIVALQPWRRWLKDQGVTTGPVFRGLTRKLARGGGKLIYEVGDEALAFVSIYKVVEHRMKQAKLYLHPNLFRNTFVAWRTAAGLTPFQIAAITGHQIDMASAASLADAARAATPSWLSALLRKP